jgi:hypothetical protein
LQPTAAAGKRLKNQARQRGGDFVHKAGEMRNGLGFCRYSELVEAGGTERGFSNPRGLGKHAEWSGRLSPGWMQNGLGIGATRAKGPRSYQPEPELPPHQPMQKFFVVYEIIVLTQGVVRGR